ncbi:hypothetical protein HFO21_07910 [Rhizobium laguerreae]|uniref:hypothetical protein n=1 Tax=Rhizobium laguerreae TaxID=1076926 RepID=UPI001C92A53D|nr:hypothetical protein [Rhizobium laguerreae]MBY3214299.1 hypothetical protein [Rhizobium laguerreae]
MITNAAYAMDRLVPNEILAMADRAHIETDLERWLQQIEAERSQLAKAVLAVRPGDIECCRSASLAYTDPQRLQTAGHSELYGLMPRNSTA